MCADMQRSGFGHPPATIRLGDLEVNRLGLGAMRLPGPKSFGEPADPERARSVLRRAVELGINLIDTAWYYGPYVANRLIAETLHPYPKGLVIACKLGGRRTPDGGWAPFIRPEELKKGCEEDLRGLRLDRIDIVHLRYMSGAGVPLLEALDALIALQAEGKIRHIALSNVSAPQIEEALRRTPIVAVQNMYTMSGGGGQLARMAHAEIEDPEAALELCERRGIAFLPFFPLAVGQIVSDTSADNTQAAVARVAAQNGRTPAQIALASLLARSPVMLPIPGTGSPAHLEENWAAREIRLSDEDLALLRAS